MPANGRVARVLLLAASALVACREPLGQEPPGIVAASKIVPASAVTQTRFRFEREGATVEWTTFDATGAVTGVGLLQVGRSDRSDAEGGAETFLFYAVASCAADECTLVEGGQGLIPDNDFAGGREHLHISTNTRDNPNMEFFAGTGGPVVVDIKAVSVASETFRGMREFRIGPSESCACSIVRRERGVTTATLATARGSVVGSSLDFVQFAAIETGRETITEISHSR